MTYTDPDLKVALFVSALRNAPPESLATFKSLLSSLPGLPESARGLLEGMLHQGTGQGYRPPMTEDSLSGVFVHRSAEKVHLLRVNQGVRRRMLVMEASGYEVFLDDDLNSSAEFKAGVLSHNDHFDSDPVTGTEFVQGLVKYSLLISGPYTGDKNDLPTHVQAADPNFLVVKPGPAGFLVNHLKGLGFTEKQGLITARFSPTLLRELLRLRVPVLDGPALDFVLDTCKGLEIEAPVSLGTEEGGRWFLRNRTI